MSSVEWLKIAEKKLSEAQWSDRDLGHRHEKTFHYHSLFVSPFSRRGKCKKANKILVLKIFSLSRAAKRSWLRISSKFRKNRFSPSHEENTLWVFIILIGQVFVVSCVLVFWFWFDKAVEIFMEIELSAN